MSDAAEKRDRSKPVPQDGEEPLARRSSRSATKSLEYHLDLSDTDIAVLTAIEQALSSPDLTPLDLEALQIARRVVLSYGGIKALKQLSDMFERQEAGTAIGDVFDVTRQRIHQWRRVLGQESCQFKLHECVKQLIETYSRPNN